MAPKRNAKPAPKRGAPIAPKNITRPAPKSKKSMADHLRNILDRQNEITEAIAKQQISLNEFLAYFDPRSLEDDSSMGTHIGGMSKSVAIPETGQDRVPKAREHNGSNEEDVSSGVPAPRMGKPTPLVRNGETCYSNAVLQALTTALDPKWLRYALGREHIGQRGLEILPQWLCVSTMQWYWRRREVPVDQLNITAELLYLLEQLRFDQGQRSISGLHWIMKRRHRSAIYDGKSQQDAYLWLLELIRCLEFGKAYQEKLPTVEGNEFIKSIFATAFEDTITCSKCKDTSNASRRLDFVVNLYPPPTARQDSSEAHEADNRTLNSNSITVKDFFRELHRPKSVDQYTCNRCNSKGGTTTWQPLTVLPDILILRFSRINQSDQAISKAGKKTEKSQKARAPKKKGKEATKPPHFEKLSYEVDFTKSFEIDLQEFCNESVNHTRYRLQSVIKHLGESHEKGHYIAYTRTGDDKWWMCDDATIKEVNIAGVTGSRSGNDGQAYLAFYERIKDDASPVLGRPEGSENIPRASKGCDGPYLSPGAETELYWLGTGASDGNGTTVVENPGGNIATENVNSQAASEDHSSDWEDEVD